MNRHDEIIQASPKRWLVAALLVYVGAINGFTVFIFVTINGLLASYFKIDAKVVDWLYLGSACGSICFGCLMGTLAKYRSVTVKTWFLVALILDLICFTAIIATFLEAKLLPLMFLGQFLNGFAVVTVTGLIPITASVWFREKEQATVYGLGYAAALVGNGAAAVVPSIFLGSLIYNSNNVSRFQLVMVIIFAFLCVTCVGVTMATWRLLPDFPRFPPTMVEAHRLQIEESVLPTGFRELCRDFLRELRILARDRRSLFLILAYDVATTALVLQFMFLPFSLSSSVEDMSGSFVLELNAHKAYMLSCMSVGGMLGTVVYGRALDKLKSYRVLACVLGFSCVVFPLLIFLSVRYHVPLAPYVAIFLFGASLAPIASFCGEILKQYVYPNVTEITQGITFICSRSLLQLVISPIFRSVMDAYGRIWFYLMMLLWCSCLPVLMFTINPRLNRFNYQSLP